jgi:hypothetical protein
MPSHRRRVYIHREADEETNNERLAAVRNTIDTFYGSSTPAIVEFSTKLPVKLGGTKAEAISRLWHDNQPMPIIPTASGSSVKDAVRN